MSWTTICARSAMSSRPSSTEHARRREHTETLERGGEGGERVRTRPTGGSASNAGWSGPKQRKRGRTSGADPPPSPPPDPEPKVEQPRRAARQ